MAKPAVQLVTNFISHLNYLEKTRQKMEFLLASGLIVRRDIEQVYEGLFLDVVTSFESFLEDLFIGLLLEKYTVSPPYKCKTIFKSEIIAREVTFGGRPYLDWLPLDQHTLKRAPIFFKDGLPFSRLDKSDKKQIAIIGILRNSIAHSSDHSQARFLKEVVGDVPLPPRERSPAGFLRSIIRISPTQNRYENLTTTLVDIMRKIAA